MSNAYLHRAVETNDLEIISKFPQDEFELYFMYPKAIFPLTINQLQASIDNRFDSTVVLYENKIVGFANFYKVKTGHYCSIGNVIVDPLYRGKGVGVYLINLMEGIALQKYSVKEVHISCFNSNITGLLLYNKLGFVPYEIEKRFDRKSFPIALIKMKKELQKPM
jgi:ribosomal protein S18 acetylase RimI-like enzyme